MLAIGAAAAAAVVGAFSAVVRISAPQAAGWSALALLFTFAVALALILLFIAALDSLTLGVPGD